METSPQINTLHESRRYLFMKRTIDIVGAFCGIILLSWLFIIVAISN